MGKTKMDELRQWGCREVGRKKGPGKMKIVSKERERGEFIIIYFWFNCIDGAWDWAGKWNWIIGPGFWRYLLSKPVYVCWLWLESCLKHWVRSFLKERPMLRQMLTSGVLSIWFPNFVKKGWRVLWLAAFLARCFLPTFSNLHFPKQIALLYPNNAWSSSW